MNILQNFCPDDRMQVSFHKVEHQVNVFIILRSDQMLQSDDVRVPI